MNRTDIYAKKRVGEINYSKTGIKMEIIAYRNAQDIDIRVDDSKVLCHRTYDSFKNGILFYDRRHSYREGEEIINKNGYKMRIIAYRNAKDIDIEFEDGTKCFNRQYWEFKSGLIRNPSTIRNRQIIMKAIKES